MAVQPEKPLSETIIKFKNNRGSDGVRWVTRSQTRAKNESAGVPKAAGVNEDGYVVLEDGRVTSIKDGTRLGG